MDAKWYAYFLLLSAAAMTGICRWRIFGPAEKTLSILLVATLTNELTALYAGIHYHNAFPIYHVFSPLELMLISIYFNRSVEILGRRGIGIWSGCVGILLAGLNVLLLQKGTTINSNFLLFEGTVVIIYCLLALRQILLDEDRLPYVFVLFWVSLCFLIYWGATFIGWGVYAIMNQEKTLLGALFNKVLATANFIFYSGMIITFLCFKKLIPSGDE